MVIDISSLDLRERPELELKNADETPIAILGNAHNLKLSIAYNDVSSITFDVPAFANGEPTPHYDDIIGMRLIDFVGIGMFILVNPETSGDGIHEIKTCKAYSREFEFTYKQISLQEGTYNFYNTVAPDNTILGIILEYLPYWSIGEVDSDLIGKYRTFSISDTKVYDFLKNTVQKTYGCIFDFDTYNRRINVRSTANHSTVEPVYLSTSNLVKEIEKREDTENIFTCLDVNGADGVTIRGVNPLGTNKIYNLDYFMNLSHFSQSFIDKWNNWKETLAGYQDQYHLLTIERMLKTSEIVAMQAKIDEETNAELGALKVQQSVYIEALARLAYSEDPSSAYQQAQADLTNINAQIAALEAAVSTEGTSLAALEAEKDALTASLQSINRAVAFESFFTAEEILLLKQYFKEDSISDSSFVYAEAKNYTGTDETRVLSGATISITGSSVTTTPNGAGRTIYTFTGGSIAVGNILTAALVSATVEYNSANPKHTVLTAYLNAGTIGTSVFPNGCLTAVTDGGSASSGETTGTFSGGTGHMYFTRNTTEYEKYAVEWELYQYGSECLSKLAYPSYSFSVTAANFLTAEEFEAFKNSLKLGQKIYLDAGYETPLQPIFTGFEVDFENPASLELEFGDTYNISDSAFDLVDLLEQSVTMGKTVDISKFGYNAFLDSGASTAVKDYMDSALDVAKQAILSSTNIAVEWDGSGMTFRKWNDAHTGYLPTQIKIINDNIVFTDNGWQTAKMAIGHFTDTNTGDSWGIIAPNIVGTLLAGENLVIESTKPDGTHMAFKVDADGAALYNSWLDIVRGNYDPQTYESTGSTQILLNPDVGFGLGTYPVLDANGEWDETNAKFWVDMAGNVHIKGTLHGVDGTFSGTLSAATGTFAGTVQAARYLDSNGNDMFTNNKFGADWLNLKGLTIYDDNDQPTFSIDSNGNVTLKSGTISWGDVGNKPNFAAVATSGNYNDLSNSPDLSHYVSDSSLSDTLAGYALLSGLSGGSTHIDANCIYSGQIAANHLSLYGMTVWKKVDGQQTSTPTMQINNDGTIVFGADTSLSWGSISGKPSNFVYSSDFSDSSTAAGAVKNTADNAASTAATAYTNAGTAQTMANNAADTASNAQRTANAAADDAAAAYTAAGNAQTAATAAKSIAAQIAEGTYTGTTIDGTTYYGTFINGTSIYSPTIIANEFIAKAQTNGVIGHYKLQNSAGYDCLDISYYDGVPGYVNFYASSGYLRMSSYAQLMGGTEITGRIDLVNGSGYVKLYGSESDRLNLSAGVGTLFFQLES